MAKNFVLLLLLFAFINTSGQRYLLMLQTKNRNKNVYYNVGDELTFYIGESRIKDEIIAIEDSTIVFKGYRVHIKEITALHIDEKTRWWLRFKAAQLLLYGGTGYLAVDVINQGELDKNTLAISGSMIGVGIICKLLFPNKIKLKRRVKLRILKL